MRLAVREKDDDLTSTVIMAFPELTQVINNPIKIL